ncbi:MAG: HlyD family efflux transporter periplasmic adaptor subunit [Verrucomicrobiota bacterium]
MSKLTPNVPRYQKRHSLLRRLMGGWSFLVWLAMIGVTYLCYLRGGAFLPLNGQVLVVKENVAGSATARLSKIEVVPGQVVKSGDVIAQLDTSLIDLKIEELGAKLRRQRQVEGLEALDRQRRLMSDAQNMHKTISEIEIEQERDKSTRTALAERYEVLGGLIKKGLVTDAEYFRVGVELAVLEPKIKKYPEFLAQYQRDLADIKEMQQLMEAAGLTLHADPAGLTPEVIVENDPQIKELRMTKAEYTLRAASAGTVGRINFQIGELVSSGTAVAEIIKQVPATIETFVPEPLTIHVVLGQKFYVSALTAPYHHYPATVTSITPQIVGQLDKTNSIAERVIRGRRLVLTPVEPTNLTPGESVMIEQVRKSLF